MRVSTYISSLLFLALSSAAFADEGAFVSANIGSPSFSADAGIPDGLESGTSRRVSGGYRWGVLGIEAGYADVGSTSELSTTGSGVLLAQELDLSGWTLGLQGRFRLADRWHLLARGGMFRWNYDVAIRLGEGRGRFEDSGAGWYTGVGVAFDVSPKFSLTLDADRYETGGDGEGLAANVFSAGAEFRF
ncbi:MAG: hypothetical protein AMXMBFR59_17720 [Rhodanobacteraceae bacterium]